MNDILDERQPAWQRTGTIVLVALTLRLLWALAVPVGPVSDSVLYDAFARSIAGGHGYAFPAGNLTVFWPVGTSAVYAALYRLFGAGPAVVVTFQILLGGVLVALVISLTRRIADRPTAALAGWGVAVWPVLVQFTTVLASELIFMTLLIAALRVWLATGLSRLPRAASFGLLIAAATYVRPTAWPLLVLLPALAAWIDRRPREQLAVFAISTLVAALCFAPWVQRNHALYDRFVLVSANGGVNLWMGNNPQSNGGYMEVPDRPWASEVDRDRELGREAVEFIRSNPIAYLKLSARRLVGTFDRESIGVVWNEPSLVERLGRTPLTPLKLLSAAYWWAMLLLGAVGVAMVCRDPRRRRLAPLLLVLGFLVAVPVLTVGGDRYHLPADPFLAVFAAIAVRGFLERRQDTGRR